MTWAMGKDEILRLIANGELQRVQPNAAFAERLMGEAEQHIDSTQKIIDTDPPGAFQLGYDAARKACEALLAVQGLRSTRQGGHIATADAVRAQFNGPRGHPAFGKLGYLRRRRAGTEYPEADTPPITHDDALDLLAEAKEVVEAARALLDRGVLTPFDD